LDVVSAHAGRRRRLDCECLVFCHRPKHGILEGSGLGIQGFCRRRCRWNCLMLCNRHGIAFSAAKIKALKHLAVAAGTADTFAIASLPASAWDLAVLANTTCVRKNPPRSPARKWIVNTERYRRSEFILMKGMKTALVW
ncbi:unnamed protein product, partial [Ascophyllum nodosum]